jgi:Protein of unknown function (DUF429)
MLVLGFDPGGETGLALLKIAKSQSVEAVVASAASVDEAVEWAVQECRNKKPVAAGIDTFLCWSTARSGWRPMDSYLRDTFSVVYASVLSSNSAYGAMAVQGMAIAMRLRDKWPKLRLNETHPKVLYYALTRQYYMRDDISPMVEWLSRQFDHCLECRVENEHQWDALISAWGTWLGISGKWKRDLVPRDSALLFPAGRVTYFWPE